ncbi:MAG TPA: PQQ-binding-like beta-propeller repeat protein [Pirellulales bacterium]|nr:PQQ-binding-like beta-propeller repeat protein [Pirellulales bacterium]
MWAVGIVLSASPGTARAQVVLAAPAAAEEANPNDPKLPFHLPSQSSDVKEALEDFHRYASKETWERAFKALDKVQSGPPNALTPRGDGLMMPTRLLLRQALAELPAAGKQAYRLFHDADAKVLLDEAKGADEMTKLERILSSYFITSVGDVAADRLGDIYFEQGEMDRAADCWQAVLQYRPESALVRVRLLVKSAIALARAGRWDEFVELKRQVHERHAGETVVLGGKPVSAEEHLDALWATHQAEPTSAAAAQNAALSDLKLPATLDPAWQFRMLGPKEAQMLATMGQNWGWGRLPVSEMVPPAVIDDKRAYVNLLGYIVAIDLKTGKLLWRSAKFHDLVQKMQNNPQGHQPEQYNLAVAGDTLWAVFREQQQQGQPFRIGRWEAATGKAGWNSSTVADLQPWNIMGNPLPVDDRVIVAASKQGQGAELHLLSLAAADGKLRWSTHLGTHQADQNQMWGFRRTEQPSVIMYGGKVYVDTHAGALVAVDLQTGALDWGFTYDSQMPETNRWWGMPQETLTAGPPLVVENKIYFKGMQSPRLYCIDLAGPTLVWKREVSKKSLLVGIDRERIYLGGEEVMAIDMKTRKLTWSTPVPMATGWIRPVMTEHRVYQFTSRGVYELDKTSGDQVRLFRGADLDSLGGTLLVTPEALVTVSNLSVTSYRVEGAAAKGNESASVTGSKP